MSQSSAAGASSVGDALNQLGVAQLWGTQIDRRARADLAAPRMAAIIWSARVVASVRIHLLCRFEGLVCVTMATVKFL